MYDSSRDIPISVQWLYWHPFGKLSHQAAQICTAVVPNTVCIRLIPLEWCTATCIIEIVPLLDEFQQHCPVCVKSLWNTYNDISKTTVYIRIAGLPNVVRIIFPLVWCTIMRIIGILHLLHEMLRDLPICVQRMHGHPYGNASQKAVQNPIAVVPKCCLHQRCPLGVVYCTRTMI